MQSRLRRSNTTVYIQGCSRNQKVPQTRQFVFAKSNYAKIERYYCCSIKPYYTQASSLEYQEEATEHL